MDAIRSGEWVHITSDGPLFDINGGKLTLNGIALTKAAWQALSSVRGTPNHLGKYSTATISR